MNSDSENLEKELKVITLRKADVLLSHKPEAWLEQLTENQDSKVCVSVALLGNSRSVNSALLQDPDKTVRRAAKIRVRLKTFQARGDSNAASKNQISLEFEQVKGAK